MQQLHSWARLNCISIHPIKTEIMFISKSPFIGPIPPIILDNHLINCTTQSSSLGVTLDNKLCWAPHIKSVTANFNAKISKLKQIKSFDISTLESILKAYYQAQPIINHKSIINLFTKHATSYNLRDNLKFDLTHIYWKGNNDSFTHQASIIWNSLPVKIKSLPSFALFKANLVKHSKYVDRISFGCSSTSTSTPEHR